MQPAQHFEQHIGEGDVVRIASGEYTDDVISVLLLSIVKCNRSSPYRNAPFV